MRSGKGSRTGLNAVTLAGALIWGSIAGIGHADASLEEVDVELVLAVDVSYSMDEEEQRIQRQGYVSAIRSPEVMLAVESGLIGKIAVSYVEWAGAAEQTVVVGWHTIDDVQSAEVFAQALEEAPLRRTFRTSISSALDFSARMFDFNNYEGLRKVIDISGDGPNNQGGLVSAARDAAVAQGIIINGLPLMMERPFSGWFDLPNLDAYYQDCVIGGPGAFTIPVESNASFAQAVRAKLVFEIAGLTPYPPNRVQLASGREPVACDIGEQIWRDRMSR